MAVEVSKFQDTGTGQARQGKQVLMGIAASSCVLMWGWGSCSGISEWGVGFPKRDCLDLDVCCLLEM